MIHRYIGDRAFYRRCLRLTIPIMVQMGITNFVNLLDNIMVGQIGTISMSGVSIVNGLIFVFNLCIFGASAGAGIFTAQFHGSMDHRGIRYTFRFKLIICTLLSLVGVSIFLFGEDFLIRLYLTGDGDAATADAVAAEAGRYLHIMLLGFLPFALTNVYSSTLKECDNTVVPMVGGVLAVLVNLCFNYILIFGHLGFPALGVEGAAIATVLSRFVELAIVAGWTHLHPKEHPFIKHAYRSLYIPGVLLTPIIIKGLPLLVNEALWSGGMAFLNQCYSTCGLDVVPAVNISTTLFNLASVAFQSTGNAVGIIMGQQLGTGCSEAEARDYSRKLITLVVFTGTIFGALMASTSRFFPMLFNTDDSVRRLASWLICITACAFPFNSYTTATYFTLRSGGQTLVTFLFDSCFVWVVCVPLAYCLSRFTDIHVLLLFAICQGTDLVKCALGAYMLKQGKWIQNLTI